jgi:hypothetical protein
MVEVLNARAVMCRRCVRWPATAKPHPTRNASLRLVCACGFVCEIHIAVRRQGRLQEARRALQRAADLGASVLTVAHLSKTYLNLAAIESALGRHPAALEHAQSALFHAQRELMALVDPPDGGGAAAPTDEEVRAARLVTAMASHNLAVELECTGRGDACLQVHAGTASVANSHPPTCS